MRVSTSDLCWPAVERLDKRLLAQGSRNLHLDFHAVEYVTGAALGKLVAVRRKVPITLVNVRPEVQEIFEITGLARLFDIHGAMSSFRREKFGAECTHARRRE